MLSMIKGADNAEDVIRADMADFSESGLIEHCITRLHNGLTVHLSDGILFREAGTDRYIRDTDS